MIKDVQIAEPRIAYHGAKLRVVRYRTLRGTICTSVCTLATLSTSALYHLCMCLYLLDLHPDPGPGAVVEHYHEVGAHL